MTPVILIQWIGAVLAAIYGAKYGLGIDLVGVFQPAPNSAAVPSAAAANVTSGATPRTAVEDVASNPISIWGVAAVGFVAVFLIAQLRAAGRDVGAGLRDTTSALTNPEGSVKVK